MSSRAKLATLVIPTLNRYPILAARLPKMATVGFDEILVVDSTKSGTDVERTRTLCARTGAEYIHESCGRSRARNLGASYAEGRWILFCDDDGYVVSRLDRERLSHLPSEVDFLTLEGHLAWMFRRDFFLQIGGYDEGLVAGEDDELTRRAFRLGHRASADGIVTGAVQSLSESELAWDRFRRLRNHFEYGITALAFASRHPSRGSVLRASFRKALALGKGESPYGLVFRIAGSILLIIGLLGSPIYYVKYRINAPRDAARGS